MRKTSLKNVTIIELLVAINKRFSDKTALQIKTKEGFRKLSYTELGARSAACSSTLKRLGVERGDRVAILSESRPEWAVAFFGIVSCAGITVPMDVKLSDAEIEFILGDSEAKCVFVSEKFCGHVLRLKPHLPKLQHIISLEETAPEGVLLAKDFTVDGEGPAHREVVPDDTVLIVYTSGTTGTAKGVELLYRNLLFEITSLHDLITFSPRDNYLSMLPLNHMLEITGGFLAPLYTGGTVTYCDSLKPTTIQKMMKETGTSVMITVPLVLKMFHDGIMKKVEDMPAVARGLFQAMLHVSRFLLKFHIRSGRLFFGVVHAQFGGKNRCFVSGGAPLDPVVELDFNALGFRVLQGYGLTETSPVLTVNNFEECKYGSVGKPLPGCEVKIVKSNESVNDGEIVARGPNIMKGYYRNPEKTLEVLKDGWFSTGDIGYFDRDGFLFISGRIKNLIVLGAGKKVFPEEIEEVMSKSPFIKELCVMGRVAQKGVRKGCEEVFALIVPNLDMFSREERQDKEAVRKKIARELARFGENLAEYKRIIDFDLWDDELPKTSTRKIKRKVLLEMVARKDTEGGAGERGEFVEGMCAQEDGLTRLLRQVVCDVAKVPQEKIVLTANLYNDLGIDSLMKVELFAAIERKEGIDIPDRLAYEVNTFADLVKFTREYKSGRHGDELGMYSDITEFIRSHARFKASHGAAYFMFRAAFSVYLRRRIEGIENLPKEDSFIIAANHSSMLDFPLILTSLPYAKMRKVFASAADDFFYHNRLRRQVVELLFNTFPFERMGDFMKGLNTCEILIRQNRSVILFPEGRRSPDGRLKAFKPGLGTLALKLNVPILPVYIDGAYEAMPKGKVIPAPRPVRVIFGKPLYPREADLSACVSDYEKYARLSRLAFEAVDALKGGK